MAMTFVVGASQRVIEGYDIMGLICLSVPLKQKKFAIVNSIRQFFRTVFVCIVLHDVAYARFNSEIRFKNLPDSSFILFLYILFSSNAW